MLDFDYIICMQACVCYIPRICWKTCEGQRMMKAVKMTRSNEELTVCSNR